MNKINIGCGPDLKVGWVNTDNNMSGDWVTDAEFWDITQRAPEKWHNQFDFALVNHTLCLLSYDDADKALINIKEVLKPGGVLQVIDMDTLLAFSNLDKRDPECYGGHTGSLLEQMCKHLVGFGRKSIYTTTTMLEKMLDSGYTNVRGFIESEHNIRPKESFVVEGTK